MKYFFYQFKNHICNDSLSDWFNVVHAKFSCFEKDPVNSFQKELNEQKIAYKLNFLHQLKQLIDVSYFKENLSCEDTHNLIVDKKECIFWQCSLFYEKLNIEVKPDFIIHKNLLRQLFPQVKFDLKRLQIYLTSDIVYKIITFNSEKNNLLNQGFMYYHKCKMYIASQALDALMNTQIHTGYLFGKEYRHLNKILIKKETIGYFKLLDEYETSVINAINWLNKLYQNYDEWLIYPKPSVNELYPNMNLRTSNWYNEKKQLATFIQEITLVWNISYKKRCILLEKGIAKWSDPILLGNIYPYQVKENHREMIQDKMISINSQNELKISPRKIKQHEFIEIIKNQKNSIILDIESVLNLDEKESYFENELVKNIETPKVCIIGTIINDEKVCFKDFTIRYLSNEEEKKIIEYWVSYLKKYFQGTIRVYHWGNAEKVYLTYMKDKFPEINYPNFEMIDVLLYFKKEPITIQGCFGYGLKEIVKQLYNLKLIENQWTDSTDALDAMMKIMKTSEEAQLKNIPLKRFTEIKKIIYYNYMDCRVIIDILKMLETMI